jgi:excisionase family DNA binding protein
MEASTHEWLTREQAAEKLQISIPTLDRMIDRSEIRATRISGRLIRIHRSEIELLRPTTTCREDEE